MVVKCQGETSLWVSGNEGRKHVRMRDRSISDERLTTGRSHVYQRAGKIPGVFKAQSVRQIFSQLNALATLKMMTETPIKRWQCL